MTEMVQSEKPFGVLLLAVFWILVAIPFFFIASHLSYYRVVVLVLTLFGTLFILVGCGLLLLNKYAYYGSMILCIVALVPCSLLVLGFFFTLLYGGEFLMGGLFFLFFLVLVMMLVYQLKLKDKFFL